jgi:hypothetical protein
MAIAELCLLRAAAWPAGAAEREEAALEPMAEAVEIQGEKADPDMLRRLGALYYRQYIYNQSPRSAEYGQTGVAYLRRFLEREPEHALLRVQLKALEAEALGIRDLQVLRPADVGKPLGSMRLTGMDAQRATPEVTVQNGGIPVPDDSIWRAGNDLLFELPRPGGAQITVNAPNEAPVRAELQVSRQDVPPKVTVSVSDGGTLAPGRTPIRVKLTDSDGIDPRSISVVMEYHGTPTWLDALVREGKYSNDGTTAVPYKRGDLVPLPEFPVVPNRGLGAGEYWLIIKAADKRGNEMPTKEIRFRVGGAQ